MRSLACSSAPSRDRPTGELRVPATLRLTAPPASWGFSATLRWSRPRRELKVTAPPASWGFPQPCAWPPHRRA